MGSNLMILEVDELTWQAEMRLIRSSWNFVQRNFPKCYDTVAMQMAKIYEQ